MNKEELILIQIKETEYILSLVNKGSRIANYLEEIKKILNDRIQQDKIISQ